jgi:hypothetical protein
MKSNEKNQRGGKKLNENSESKAIFNETIIAPEQTNCFMYE